MSLATLTRAAARRKMLLERTPTEEALIAFNQATTLADFQRALALRDAAGRDFSHHPGSGYISERALQRIGRLSWGYARLWQTYREALGAKGIDFEGQQHSTGLDPVRDHPNQRWGEHPVVGDVDLRICMEEMGSNLDLGVSCSRTAYVLEHGFDFADLFDEARAQAMLDSFWAKVETFWAFVICAMPASTATPPV